MRINIFCYNMFREKKTDIMGKKILNKKLCFFFNELINSNVYVFYIRGYI